MHCVGLAATLLLALLCIQDTTAVSRSQVERSCKTKFPPKKCHTLGKGWYKMDGTTCIKLFTRAKKFTDAQAACSNECGDLVSMHNAKQYSEVLCLLIRTSGGKQRVWVGGQRQSNGKFGWTDKSNFKFSRWNRGEPNNYKGKESCMEMNFGAWGHWNDMPCNRKKRYVCAKKV